MLYVESIAHAIWTAQGGDPDARRVDGTSPQGV
jgi:hypothetical protein